MTRRLCRPVVQRRDDLLEPELLEYLDGAPRISDRVIEDWPRRVAIDPDHGHDASTCHDACLGRWRLRCDIAIHHDPAVAIRQHTTLRNISRFPAAEASVRAPRTRARPPSSP